MFLYIFSRTFLQWIFRYILKALLRIIIHDKYEYEGLKKLKVFQWKSLKTCVSSKLLKSYEAWPQHISYTDVHLHRYEYISISLSVNRYTFIYVYMNVRKYEYSLDCASHNFNKLADWLFTRLQILAIHIFLQWISR